jgi:hypothetical protein
MLMREQGVPSVNSHQRIKSTRDEPKSYAIIASAPNP